MEWEDGEAEGVGGAVSGSGSCRNWIKRNGSVYIMEQLAGLNNVVLRLKNLIIILYCSLGC